MNSNDDTVAAPNDSVAIKSSDTVSRTLTDTVAENQELLQLRYCSRATVVESLFTKKIGFIIYLLLIVRVLFILGIRKRYEENKLGTSIDQHLITVARQSIRSIDRHLTVLIDTNISGKYTRETLFNLVFMVYFPTNLRLYNTSDSVV